LFPSRARRGAADRGEYCEVAGVIAEDLMFAVYLSGNVVIEQILRYALVAIV